jgi:type I restriction enzyme R subunit
MPGCEELPDIGGGAMSPEISERAFEEAIECALLQHGPDACAGFASAVRETSPPFGENPPGGYRRRKPDDYDRTLCLLPRDVVDFVLATQPKEWKKLAQHHGAAVREQFLKRLAAEIERRGALDVLRNGLKDSGCKFRLAYFRPASGLNEETRRLHAANLFSVVRQVHYSTKNEQSLDLVLFLNGIPIFTAELKNPLTGQDVEDAIRQYKTDRDPREPLLAYGRCLAHFAVDPDLVYVTTHLQGARTRFLPFNRGKFGGAGNPPVPPTRQGHATAYLWEETWARDSVLDLVRQFVHEVEEEDEKGRKTGRRFLIFPRYQQLDCVRKLVADSRARGAGQRYLVQHSAGSGKSFTIAWLAHQLATLHDASDRRVFDSIVVVTDRRVLDRQLQTTMRQFEQTLGVVENIDTTSRQLKEALESGKTIIVTTLQKFPVIAKEIGELPGKRFAVIVDEAHSSQSGESTKSLKAVLASRSLEEAEAEESGAATPEEELESRILAEMERRGRLPNLSTFAFTATPKPKTLELFGTRRPDGKFAAFYLYSMRQAIEEGFILDVLASYTTYKAYWRLLKKVEDDPRYDRKKAEYLLKSFVELHPHAIGEKVRIMVEHFAAKVQGEIGGKAKAMVVTRSRLYAVRYKLAMDKVLAERGYPFNALVAFSGTVQDGGQSYTEANMNGFPEAQTAKTFERPEYRFLIVANKFQTGFDQPLLHTMYVDKPMRGHGLMQAIARVNRVFRDKPGGLVVDYLGLAHELKAALATYTESGGTGRTALDQDEAVALLREKYEVCCGLFHGFDRSAWIGGTPQQRLGLLPAAQEHILKQENGKERCLRAVRELSQAFALAVPHEEALRIRDDVAFFQAVAAALAKRAPGTPRAEEELDHAIRQIVSKAIAPEGVVDLFAAAGLKKPDISILSDEFLAEVRGMPQRNLAVELLQKLLKGEIRTRRRKNVVQARSFAEMLEQTIRRYQNRAIEAAQVIEELIALAKEMREANARGEALGLSEDELAFYDALETNDSAVKVLGEPTLTLDSAVEVQPEAG